jgi:hypothetical protein
MRRTLLFFLILFSSLKLAVLPPPPAASAALHHVHPSKPPNGNLFFSGAGDPHPQTLRPPSPKP